MSTTKNDGGPAFPMPTGPEPRDKATTHYNEGMTLRQWYAGMALQGLLSNSGAVPQDLFVLGDDGRLEYTAQQAFLYADAMLAHEAPRQPEEA